LKSAAYFCPGTDVNITRYPDYFNKYNKSVDNEERMYKALDWLDLPESERYCSLHRTMARNKTI